MLHKFNIILFFLITYSGATVAKCINHMPIYELTDNKKNSSYLIPVIHRLHKSYEKFPFPDGIENIINKTNTVVIERYDFDPMLSPEENQEELEATYTSIKPDTWNRMLQSKTEQEMNDVLYSQLDEIKKWNKTELSNQDITLLLDMIDKNSSIKPQDKKNIIKKFLAMKPEAAIFNAMAFIPNENRRNLREENFSAGMDFLLVKKFYDARKNISFLEKPADIINVIKNIYFNKEQIHKALTQIKKEKENDHALLELYNASISLLNGDSVPVIKYYGSNNSEINNFLYNPIARAREKYWAPRIKEMMKSEKCPCIFAVGAMHVIDPNYLRKSLLENGISSKQINLPDDK